MAQSAPEPGRDDPLALQGVVPPTLTIFDEDGAVDHGATAAHAQFVVDGGARGVFALGTNGEFALLSGEERAAVVETVVDAVDVPVIAGVGAPSTRATVANARRARTAGADGVVVVTPYYYPLDDRGAVDHFRAVAGAVDVPVYAYQIPAMTGIELTLATLDRISAIDGVAGVKDSSQDVPWLAQAVDDHPELTFLVGSDALLVAGLAVGCAGLVSGVANVFPELVVELYDAYDAGNETETRQLQSAVFDVRSALDRGPYLAGVKAAISLRDVPFDVGRPRPPLRELDDCQRDVLAEELRDVGLL